MYKKIVQYSCLIFCMLVATLNVFSQDSKLKTTLTLEEVIQIACDQSLDAFSAKQKFRASYWRNRSYKANFLPSLKFDASIPQFSNSYRILEDKDSLGNVRRTAIKAMTNDLAGSLSINQNMPLTGGVLSVTSSLARADLFENNLNNKLSTSYISNPFAISYRQNLFGLNQMKWDKKVEPLKFDEAKKRYLIEMEDVALKAIRSFFELALAQQNLAVAKFNYSNNDTLYKVAKGRFNIGTIGENDMLQSELNFMNTQLALNDAELRLENSKIKLASFLGFNEKVDLNLIIPEHAPEVVLDVAEVLAMAKANHPNLIAFEIQLVEAQKSVAQAKADRGFRADLNLSYGVNQSGADIRGAYDMPMKSAQTVAFGVTIPILDWGRGKGRVKMAQSQEEITRSNIEQQRIDFDQNVVLKVRQYGQQATQLKIAAKSDTIAQSRYNVTKARFLIDKVTITDMNNAEVDRNGAQVKFVNTLRDYWTYYYELRQLTLFDLYNGKPLEADYDSIVR